MAGQVSVTNAVGPSLGVLLGITFIVLKLTAVINWAWVWVLAPFWIPVAVFVLIFVGILITGIIKSLPPKTAKK